jgi:hypothetical protein
MTKSLDTKLAEIRANPASRAYDLHRPGRKFG